MANEISVSAALAISKNGVVAQLSKSISNTLSGNTFASGVQTTASTTREAFVPPADLTLGGFLIMANLDSTSTITVHYDNSTPDATNTIAALLPGEFCLFKPAAGATVYLTPTAGGDVGWVHTEL